MQNPIAGQNIDYTRYLRLLWKRKWLILLPAVLFPVAAALYAMRMEDSFQSTTLILVQPQKVPTQFVASTVTTGIEERLHTISQQIFSRTRLEQIIHEFNLFEKARGERAPEEVVQSMRSRIQLKTHRNDAFQLSFIDPNPRLAMLVTNKLASLFIEENLKVREQQAIGTSQFLQDEIDRYREKVREREKAIYEFREQHMSELPEQLASNQSRLNQLQNQLQINSQDINAAENRRLQLQQQLADIERRAEEQAVAPAGGSTGPDLSISEQLTRLFNERAEADLPGLTVDDSRLRVLEEERKVRRAALETLLLSYTEKHPDVARVQGEIERLDDKIAQEEAALEAERERARALRAEAAAAAPEPAPVEPTAPEDSEPVVRYPPVYEKLKSDLLRAEADIARLTEQNREIRQQAETYQRRLAATPGRQLQLQQLSEDYDNLKAVLESLINKKLQADLSENLERKQKGEQFKILDPANLPEKPFQPNRLRIVGGGLVAGLALGFGVVLLLDFLDTSVKTREELSQTLEVPVLGMIPEILTVQDVRRRWSLRVGVSGGVLLCLLLAASVVHLNVKPLPEAARDLYQQVRATHWTTIR